MILDSNEVVNEDLSNIYNDLSEEEKSKFDNATVLMTGCGGFLGFYFLKFLISYADKLNIKKIIGLENFLTEDKGWLSQLESEPRFSLHKFDIINDDLSSISDVENATLVIHAASIASPVFYRKYPLETIDANITGLRRLLDFYCDKNLTGFLFFSSSEVYGDPFPEFIPTSESYRGNVATTGPRACYDEAKRFGETLCYTFAQKYDLKVTVVRPFNNYGPGMSLHDQRLPADFAKAIFRNENINILSDGSPTRTFCYISDAISGYLKVLLHGKFDIFNIGMDKPEISVKEFAKNFTESGQDLFSYTGKTTYKTSTDKNYLTDNPNRRCPNIDKARAILDYCPQVEVKEGVSRFLRFIKINNQETL